MIGEGVVDRDGVAGLARRLAYSPRQLNRLLVSEVGAGPLALARAQRAQTARVLVETTELPVIVGGVRGRIRQRAAIQRHHPPDLRLHAHRVAPAPALADAGARHRDTLSLRLAHRLPYDGPGTLAFLAHRAVPGVEVGTSTQFARTLTLPHGCGTVELVPEDGHVRARLRLDDLRDLTPAVQRCRHLLDLDADPVAVADHLERRPGHRGHGPARPRACGYRAPWTPTSWRCAPSSANRCRWRAPAPILGRLVAEHGAARRRTCSGPDTGPKSSPTAFPTWRPWRRSTPTAFPCPAAGPAPW